jgi:hypothetical protein
MSRGDFVFKLASAQKNGIQTLKNRVTTPAETALLGARPVIFGGKECLKLSTPFKK